GVPLGLVEAWVALLSYSFQIYFDFSAYSDMALGLSRMFGVELPLNFDSPYRAANLVEFWRRWHMSLSAFLRDYVYIPLGGSRGGVAATSRNLGATFLLGGLWHGIGWNFLAWGAIHGTLLAFTHAWRSARPGCVAGRARRGAGVAATFLAVTLAWVPFRADGLGSAGRFFASLFGLNGVSLPRSWSARIPDLPWADFGIAFEGTFRSAIYDGPRAVVTLAILAAFVWLVPNACRITGVSAPREARLAWQPGLAWALASGTLLAASTLRLARPSAFLYFQF
ncbi:MAG: MBOAT family protein, partial [Burkholderiales bacterium]